MNCVTVMSFLVMLNGIPCEHFQPKWGLRQGDPLLPSLFMLCVEVLSGLILKTRVDGALHGVRVVRTTPKISHLFFADDSILFWKASSHEVEVIQHILHSYQKASG